MLASTSARFPRRRLPLRHLSSLSTADTAAAASASRRPPAPRPLRLHIALSTPTRRALGLSKAQARSLIHVSDRAAIAGADGLRSALESTFAPLRPVSYTLTEGRGGGPLEDDAAVRRFLGRDFEREGTTASIKAEVSLPPGWGTMVGGCGHHSHVNNRGGCAATDGAPPWVRAASSEGPSSRPSSRPSSIDGEGGEEDTEGWAGVEEGARGGDVSRRIISFYRLHRGGSSSTQLDETEVQAAAAHLQLRWSPLGVLGRCYVSTEGVNAHVSVPVASHGAFVEAMETWAFLGDMWLNVDEWDSGGGRRRGEGGEGGEEGEEGEGGTGETGKMAEEGGTGIGGMPVGKAPRQTQTGQHTTTPVHFSNLRVKVRPLLGYGATPPRAAGVDWHSEDNGVALDGMTWHEHLGGGGLGGDGIGGDGLCGDGMNALQGSSGVVDVADAAADDAAAADAAAAAGGGDVGGMGGRRGGAGGEGRVVKPSVVIDVRNMYESDLGRFDRAIPLDTETFSESWDALDRVLQDVPKDTPVYMYCTGGIRCERAGAFVKQALGFNDVFRLKGGVVGYLRDLKHAHGKAGEEGGVAGAETNEVAEVAAAAADEEEEEEEEEEAVDDNDRSLEALGEAVSLFRGINYVFDQRAGVHVSNGPLKGIGGDDRDSGGGRGGGGRGGGGGGGGGDDGEMEGARTAAATATGTAKNGDRGCTVTVEDSAAEVAGQWYPDTAWSPSTAWRSHINGEPLVARTSDGTGG